MLGIALTTTSLGALAPILRDAGILASPLGVALLGSGVAGEFWPIVVISVFLTGTYGALTEILGGEPDQVMAGLSRDIGLPSGLDALGVTEAMRERVSGEALKDHCHGTNPRIPTQAEYRELLNQSR